MNHMTLSVGPELRAPVSSAHLVQLCLMVEDLLLPKAQHLLIHAPVQPQQLPQRAQQLQQLALHRLLSSGQRGAPVGHVLHQVQAQLAARL